MDRDVDLRFRALERRMDTLERETRGAVQVPQDPPARPPVPSAPRPTPPTPIHAIPPVLDDVPTPTPTPEPTVGADIEAKTPARAPAPASPSRDWEGMVGIAVLGRIGIGAVLLAAGYFAQLAYRHMTDGLKVMVLYAVAAALLGVGTAIRRRVSRVYVGLLWGGGVAIAYMAGLVGHGTYAIFSLPIAFALLACACALGQLLARVLRAETIAIVSLSGAFAVPLLLGMTDHAHLFVLVYALALHAWSAWCEHQWRWGTARIVGAAGLISLGALQVLSMPPGSLSTWAFAHAYLVGLIAPDFLRAVRRQSASVVDPWVGAMVVVGASAALALSSRPFAFLLWSGGLWVGLGAIAAFGRPNRLARALVTAGGALLVGAGLFLPDAAPAAWTRLASTQALVGYLSGVAIVMFGLRRLANGGEAHASVAVGLASLGLLGASDAGADTALLAMAPLGVCALLLRFGKSTAARAAAHAIGALVLVITAVALSAVYASWGVIAVATAALWSCLWLTQRPLRDSRRFGAFAVFVSACISLAWAGFAFPRGTDAWIPIAGLVVVLAAAVQARATGKVRREMFAALAVITGALVGYREVTVHTADVAGGAVVRVYWTVGYFVAAAWALAYAADRRWAHGSAWASALLVTGAIFAFAHALPLAAVMVAITTCALCWRMPRKADLARLLLAGAGALAGASWGKAAWLGFDPALPFIANTTFLTGIGTLVPLCIAALRSPLKSMASDGVAVALFLALLGYLVGLHETLLLAGTADGAWPRISVSLYSMLFAAGLLAAGFARQLRGLRLLALGLFFAIIGKIGLYDLNGTPLPLRILVTGALGLVLLGASYAYARRQQAQRA